MSEISPLAATLGDVQLMAFTHAETMDAITSAGNALGLVRTHLEQGDVVAATEYLRVHASPEILLVEIASAESAPALLDALADTLNPHTRVLVTGKVDSIRFYQWLRDLGIEGYLLQPFTAVELQELIAKKPAKKLESAHGNADSPQKIIAVVGARGGVGTTMVASNLAAIFAQEHHVETALVDLDPYFGSVALSLDLEPGRGLRDAFEKPERIDSLFLERVMIKPFANLSVFAAEEPLSDPIIAQPTIGEMLFAVLQEKFNIIIVDVPRQMNSLTRHVLAAADQVILVAEPQITSLRDSLRVRDYLVEHIKCPAPMLLLNRVGISTVNELSVKEFSKNFGSDMHGQIAFMQEVIAATAQGELLSAHPKLGAALNPLRSIARAIAGGAEDEDAVETSGGQSLLDRLLGKK